MSHCVVTVKPDVFQMIAGEAAPCGWCGRNVYWRVERDQHINGVCIDLDGSDEQAALHREMSALIRSWRK